MKSVPVFFISSFALFILLLPVSLSIKFTQNDDWNRYVSVIRFLFGNFELLPVTATTFYTQGLLGMMYTSIFPLTTLPVLTLFVAILCFYVTGLISFKFYKQTELNSLLFGLLLFLNPIFIYSIWGFMTEIYLLFFVLLSIYFASAKLSLKFNGAWILGFFAKQSAIIVPMGVVASQIISKKYKLAIINFTILCLILAFYLFIFPRTSEMTGQKSIKLQNLGSMKYIFSNLFASVVYLAMFLVPITFKKIKILNSVSVLISSAIFSYLLYWLFNLTNFPWKMFPHYPNTFTAFGFFHQGISGNPSGFDYSYILNLFSIISFYLLVVFFMYNLNWKFIKRFAVSFELYSLLFGIFLIIVNPFVFDRYFLVLIPLAMFLFLRLSDYKINPKMIIIFILLEGFISLDFSLEFISRQNKIWELGNYASEKFDINKNLIRADHAWNSFHNVNLNDYEYQILFGDAACKSCNNLIMGPFESGKFLTKSKIVLIKNEKL